MNSVNKSKDSKGEERRRAKRMLVSEALSFFIVIPKMGMARVYMKDISTGGLSFWSETNQQFSGGSEHAIRLYTAPTIYLPLNVRVVRSDKDGVAVEFVDKNNKPARALAKFLEFLELATDASVVEGA